LSFADTLRSVLRGEQTDEAIKTFLVNLNETGLTSGHVRIGVEIMRETMVPAHIPDAIDIVGTGGTGLHTLSVSTATAFVCAGAGARVAKHGNRAASSLTGTADTLEFLGVNLAINPEKVAECVNRAGIGFLFAPNHHPAMCHVARARKVIGKRTLFNLLGPMSNPANTKRMLVGVNKDDWRHLMAEAFATLDMEHVWVVHGADGMDEITTTGPTFISEIRNATVEEFEINPLSYGLELSSLADLAGAEPTVNAERLWALLDGEHTAYRDIVILNAGAALFIAGRVDDIATGMDMAVDAIDAGRAKAALEKLIEASNG